MIEAESKMNDSALKYDNTGIKWLILFIMNDMYFTELFFIFYKKNPDNKFLPEFQLHT